MFKNRIPSKSRPAMVGRHRAAPAPWRRMLAAALCLGMWLAPAALGADSPNQESPDDGKLGGWVRMQHLEQVRRGAQDGCDQVVNVFLMFDLVPSGLDLDGLKAQLAEEAARWAKSSIPTQTRAKLLKTSWDSKLAWLAAGGRAATKIKYLIETDGCHDIGGSEYTCDAPGDTASGEITLGEHTATGYKQTASLLGLLGGGLTFNPMIPSVKLTSMSWATTARSEPNGSSLLHQNGRSTCVHHPSSGGPPQEEGFLPVGGDVRSLVFELSPDCSQSAPRARGWIGDSDKFCVQPTACFKATDATQRQQCVTTPGKFAVIPFEGNREQQYADPPSWGDYVIHSKISWKICDGCGQVPPPPDMHRDPCPQDMADFNLQQNRKQRDDKAANLEAQLKKYQEEMKKAESHLQQFHTTMQLCAVTSATVTVLEGSLGLFSPAGEAAIISDSPAEAEEIKEAVEMLGLLPQLGDPATTIFTVTSSLVNNEDPTAKLIPFEKYQQFLEALEAAEKASNMINGSTSQLEEELKGCPGTIGLSNENWKGANDYIEDLQEAMANVPDIQKLTNDIRQLDTQYEDLQSKAYAACLKRADCLNQPESSCDNVKPTGNWTDPQ